MTATETIQVLDPKGRLNGGDDLLGDDDHKRIFETMLKVRVFEDRCMKLQRQGRIGFYIGAYGMEASHTASAYALREDDWIFPSYRNLGILFLRGVPLQKIVDQMWGNDGDVTRGRQMPCHYSFRDVNFVSISSPIGTQIPQAVGAAMAMKFRGKDSVAVTYLGDGGTSEGDFHVACNFAGVYEAPAVIIVENNQWAISCPAEGQTASDGFAVKAKAYGIEGVRVDGNDPLATYAVTHEAVERARSGGGATLIETVTYRLFSHSSSDDRSKYVPQGEYDKALKNEPLARYRKYLEGKGLWTQEWEDDIAKSWAEEVGEAVRNAEATPAPAYDTMFDDVYSERTPILREQSRMLEDELEDREGFDDAGEFPL